MLERVTAALVAELRRRLGGRFNSEELVELYGQGTAWCLQVAMTAAPEEPWAWDAGVVVDAAFGRYLREASDYAGGRRAVAGVTASLERRLVVFADAADDYLVLLDEDLDGAVPGPVLGVDRVVLRRRDRATGRSPPRRGRRCPPAVLTRAGRSGGCGLRGGRCGACWAPPPRPHPPRSSSSPRAARSAASASARALLGFGALGLAGGLLELGGDQGVVLGAQVDLVGVVQHGRALGERPRRHRGRSGA